MSQSKVVNLFQNCLTSYIQFVLWWGRISSKSIDFNDSVEGEGVSGVLAREKDVEHPILIQQHFRIYVHSTWTRKLWNDTDIRIYSRVNGEKLNIGVGCPERKNGRRMEITWVRIVTKRKGDTRTGRTGAVRSGRCPRMEMRWGSGRPRDEIRTRI